MTLRSTRNISEEEIVRWFQATRLVALEVPGVYDLALCNSDAPTLSGFYCVLDVENEQALAQFWEDPDVQQVLNQGKQRGLELILKARWQRLA
ncbi:MAG: hypothetical protein A2Z21_10825 [Candidatus Fraserbacteria bacterium RBG_16_55_9]|uniref:ABM domain-containing protein n=1 Tax=Fraserbacteria sp. (strain RBG_16_55_9) TaxID=1817864 RepID=A0A1F5V3Y6_FRAXR|nr:MAG: hypothetical protein A2Z21_10825 [Candidatus Fraserbacteria bacterium RBG_16_55_9]